MHSLSLLLKGGALEAISQERRLDAARSPFRLTTILNGQLVREPISLLEAR